MAAICNGDGHCNVRFVCNTHPGVLNQGDTTISGEQFVILAMQLPVARPVSGKPPTHWFPNYCTRLLSFDTSNKGGRFRPTPS